MVISYEMYETKLRRVSILPCVMSTSVRFCVWYDLLEVDIFAFRMDTISIRKRIVYTIVVNDVTCTHQNVITLVVI